MLFCEIKNAVPCESLVVLSGSDEVLTDIVGVLTESETVHEMVPSLHVSQLLFQENQLQSKRIICTMQPLSTTANSQNSQN